MARRSQLFTSILKIAMLSMAVNIVFVPVNHSVAVLAGYTTIIATLALPFLGIKLPLSLRAKPSMVCLIGIGICMLCSMLAHIGYRNINIDFVKTLLSFFCCYLAIIIDDQSINKNDLRHMFLINKALGFALIAYTYLPFSFQFTEVNEWGGQQFTMGMGNPNATSINVMFCVVMLLLEVLQEKRTYKKVLCMSMIAALLGTMLKLQSRTVVICCAFILLAGIFKQIRIPRYVIALVVVFPIAMFFIQIWLGTINTDVQFLGKEIATGRDEMYAAHLQTILNNPGDYLLGQILSHRLGNYHNAPLALIMSIGGLGYLLFIIMWVYEFQGMVRMQRTKLQYIAIIALFAYMIHSSSEASPMLGGIPYATQMIILSRIAKDTALAI